MPTENHDYNTPEKGEENWNVPINENASKLDTDVEIRDTADARAGYRPKAGAKFFATDTGEVHVGDGSGWIRHGRFTRESFSASPNEGHAGIQALIDDNAPYVTIELQKGTYEGNGILLDHGVSIRGAGTEQTTLKLADGANTDVIASPSVDTRNVMEVELRDLSIDGNKANNTAGNGVYAACWDSRITNISVRYSAENGIWLAGCTGASTDDNVVVNSRAVECDGTGIKAGTNEETGVGAGAHRIANNYLGANGDGGIDCRGNAYSVYGNQLWANGYFQIRIDRSHFSTVGLNRIDPGAASTDGVYGIHVRSSGGVASTAVSLVGNVFEGAADDHLHVEADGDDVRGVTVTANTFMATDDKVGRAINYTGSGEFLTCILEANTFTGTFETAAVDVPDAVVWNGEAVESGDTETPQATYPTGTIVRFTDTGDGSGTGAYLVTRGGSFERL